MYKIVNIILILCLVIGIFYNGCTRTQSREHRHKFENLRAENWETSTGSGDDKRILRRYTVYHQMCSCGEMRRIELGRDGE